jgi:dephospho-CoA kinase
MVLLGITGTHGAGKGTVVALLEEKYNFVCFSISDFLAEEAVRRGSVADRSARARIANEYRKKSPTALVEAVYAHIPLGSERVIVEPLYTPNEVHFLKEKDGVVLAVDADLRTRYDRTQGRGGVKDAISFETFKEAQERELYSSNKDEQNSGGAMACADLLIRNDGTREELEVKIADFVRGMVF